MKTKMKNLMKNNNMQPNKIWLITVQLIVLSLFLVLSQLTLAKDRIQYHIQNFDGSTLKVINEQGVVSQSYQYAPFGQQLQYKKPSNLKDPNAFVGGVQDADDLVYLKQRHYNPVLGRFYQPDPVTFIMKGHGQTNRYQYGMNDTYTFSDLSGTWAEVINGKWVENGKSFYSASGGEFTDRLAWNMPNDVATLSGGVELVILGSSFKLLTRLPTLSFTDDAGRIFGWTNSYSKIGSTGVIGENYLKMLGGTSQIYYKTPTGGRYVDQLVGTIANESKVGYTTLTSSIQKQINKDAYLLKSKQVTEVRWNFFESPSGYTRGPSQPLREALNKAGIKIVEHYK